MPTVKRIRGYRFYFWSREEPRRHIHIDSADGTAKFWLEPDVELADFYHMKAKELRKLEKLLLSKDQILEVLNTCQKPFIIQEFRISEYPRGQALRIAE